MNSKISLLTLVAAACLAGCSTTSLHQEPSGPPVAAAHTTPLAGVEATEARQAATSFLQAVASRDWNAVAKFWPPHAPSRFEDVFTEKTKAVVGGLQIISIGGPYREDSASPGVFVPYAVRFTNGDVQRNNLQLMKNSDGQWVWLGGF